VVPLGLLSDGVSGIELLLSNQIPQFSGFGVLFIFEERELTHFSINNIKNKLKK